MDQNSELFGSFGAADLEEGGTALPRLPDAEPAAAAPPPLPAKSKVKG